MPNAPKTPLRAVRIPDDEWNELGAAVADTPTDRTKLIREFIRWYLRRPGAKLPVRPPKPEEGSDDA